MISRMLHYPAPILVIDNPDGDVAEWCKGARREVEDICIVDFVRYNSELEKKFTTTKYDDCVNVKKLTAWMGSYGFINHCEASLNLTIDSVSIDPTEHGAGIHLMKVGDYLQTHLDYMQHPKLAGYERRMNAVLYLNNAKGGETQFHDDMGNNVLATVPPIAGRVVVWENTDTSYHSVAVCKDLRATIACYYLSRNPFRSPRKRALFVPRR
jgi:Rps23 Pro-64 3,4-dihydroxylase Tpa1-like proline 4-hydroxylase